MLLHLSPADGIIPCLLEVFAIIQADYTSGERIVYFNNTTSGALLRAMAESDRSWVEDEKVLKSFEYERVSDLFELAEKLRQGADLVIIERLDRIARELGPESYNRQNEAVAEIMNLLPDDAVFIDDWAYLEEYYSFDE